MKLTSMHEDTIAKELRIEVGSDGMAESGDPGDR
jgi:hypothetical protein